LPIDGFAFMTGESFDILDFLSLPGDLGALCRRPRRWWRSVSSP
jgi:hypothetical protein